MAGKIKKIMPRAVFHKLSSLYQRMEDSYQIIADQMGFTCVNCPDNCCTSYFQHHTRIEWAYFIKGLNQKPEAIRKNVIQKAEDYVQKARLELSHGRTPDLMCPVNENGLCVLYEHRLMICRLHGVPTVHTRPDGRSFSFPGCFRSQESTQGKDSFPRLDRTIFYRELAELEQAFVGPKVVKLPRINLSLAEMIVQGPPGLSI
jgi:Fe-S-cluster containining protein